jgi:aarF domain-containing kinase
MFKRPKLALFMTASSFFALSNDIESMTRPLIFWRRMFPIYVEYRLSEFKSTSKEEWQQLHQKYAPKVLDIILELKGMYIKMGQVLSQRPDVLPKEYRDAFGILLDGIPGMKGKRVVEIVEESLGMSITDVFDYFDDIPMGAASIAQVHRARLKDGKEVVVKIQHPDASNLFGIDIHTMNRFVRLAQPEQELLLEEFEKQMTKEFDFEREAWALETIHQNCKKAFPSVLIPRPVSGLVRKNVLVMDYIPGIKLIDAASQQLDRIATGLGMSMIDIHKQLGKPSLWFKTRLFGYYVKSECYRHYSYVYNSLFGRFYTPIAEPPRFLDVAKIYKQIVQVHGKQFLIDGIFNADPHPGNILYTPDGRLGLIDFGQVKTITRKDRRNIARMLLLLSQDPHRKQEAVQLAQSLGFETVMNDPETIYKVCMIFFDRDDLQVTEGMGLQQYMEMLNRKDRGKSLPEQYIMAGRLCIILRGLGAILGPNHPPISLAHQWKKLAQQSVLLFHEDTETDDFQPFYR